MTRPRRARRSPALALVVVAALGCRVREAWRWHEAGVELHQPAFSPTGEEIVLTRRRRLPAGNGARNDDPRRADPEVVILSLETGQTAHVDWGWTPSFSPDGTRVVYAGQVRPVTSERVTAQTLAGNDIRLHDRSHGSTSILTTPATGYLTAPIFSPDGGSVVYSMGDAVDGADAGEVGIGRVHLAPRATAVLYPPTRTEGRFHVLGPKAFAGNQLLVRRRRPAPAKVPTPGAYIYDLVAPGPPLTVVYSWGLEDAQRDAVTSFAVGARDELLVYHRGWNLVGGSATAARPRARAGGVPSPNGRLLAAGTRTGLTVRELQTGAIRRTWDLGGEPGAVVWSRDSSRCAVVMTRQDAGGVAFDELVVVEP